MSKNKNKASKYTEYPSRGGLCGRKKVALNKELGLRNKRLDINVNEEGEITAHFLADKTGLSISEFILRLLLSKEAQSFAENFSGRNS